MKIICYASPNLRCNFNYYQARGASSYHYYHYYYNTTPILFLVVIPCSLKYRGGVLKGGGGAPGYSCLVASDCWDALRAPTKNKDIHLFGVLRNLLLRSSDSKKAII